jgi:hypothetical protein
MCVDQKLVPVSAGSSRCHPPGIQSLVGWITEQITAEDPTLNVEFLRGCGGFTFKYTKS